MILFDLGQEIDFETSFIVFGSTVQILRLSRRESSANRRPRWPAPGKPGGMFRTGSN